MQLIDGGMLAFAAFHAMKDKVEYPLTHQMPLMLAKIVAEAEDTFTVFWDAEHLWKRKLWRSYRDRPEIWDAAGREDFYNMFAVLSALGVLQFRAGDLEADESLAALVHSLDGAEPLLIRSDDKDFMQLLSPSTWMYGRVRGVVKPAQVEGILGVPVEHVVDWLAWRVTRRMASHRWYRAARRRDCFASTVAFWIGSMATSPSRLSQDCWRAQGISSE